MSKKNKMEYKNILNEIFETDIDWTKLNLADLEKLTNILSDDKKLIKITLKLVDIESVTEDLVIKIIKSHIKSKSSIKSILNTFKILKSEFIEKL